MESKERRNNPFNGSNKTGTARRQADWNYGYEAAIYNGEINAERIAAEAGDGAYIHGECDVCTHRRKQHYSLKVMFQIEDVAGMPSLDARGLAEQLAEALPKEWWQDSNVAEWGTVAIYALDDNGDLAAK